MSDGAHAGDEFDGLTLDLRRESTADQVTMVLRGAILAGRLPPGTPLREQQLSSRFGVSRHTLRESLRTLVHEGLARHHMHRGAEVSRLDDEDVRELYATRLIVEPLGVRRLDSDPVVRAQQTRPMVEAIDDMAEAIDRHDAVAAAAADRAFHASIVGLLGNARISAMFDQVQRELMLAMLLRDITADDHQHLHAEHAEMRDLAVQGDRVELEARLREHLTVALAELTTSPPDSVHV